MQNQQDIDSGIIYRCQNGDLKAFKLIYLHFEQPLLRIALRTLGQQQDAEDAVQMTFTKLYRSIKNFKFSSKFSTYLFRILINICYDMLEKRKKIKTVVLENENPSYQPDEELRIEIEGAISTLPERMRICFVLFAVEEFKQTEIAEILNLTVGAVKSNIFHAKTKLRSFLAQNLNRTNS